MFYPRPITYQTSQIPFVIPCSYTNTEVKAIDLFSRLTTNQNSPVPEARLIPLPAEVEQSLNAVVQEAGQPQFKHMVDGSIFPIAYSTTIASPFICQDRVLQKELADASFLPDHAMIISPYITPWISGIPIITDETKLPEAIPVVPSVTGSNLSSIHKTSRKALEILIKADLLDHTCLDKLKEAQAFELFVPQQKKEKAITQNYSLPLRMRTFIGAYVLSFFNSVPFNPQSDLPDLYNKINSAKTNIKTNSCQVILTAELSRLITTLADPETRQNHAPFVPSEELDFSNGEDTYTYQRSNIIFQVEQLASDIANISLEEANFTGNCVGIGAGVLATAALVSSTAIATIALKVVTQSKKNEAYL
jgi:hypothetical protein